MQSTKFRKWAANGSDGVLEYWSDGVRTDQMNNQDSITPTLQHSNQASPRYVQGHSMFGVFESA